jgi:DNA-binding CsgD family transcriptional regulator
LSTPETDSINELSEREREILRLVATGASNKEVAQRLYISPNTVKVHLRNIFAKIGVVSRTEAALYAIRNRIVEVPVTITTGTSAPDGATSSASTPHPSELLPVSSVQKRSTWRIRLTLIALIAFSILIGWSLWGSSQLGTRSPFPSPTPIVSHWEDKASMPTARSGLGTVVYENQIYALGGESPGGVTGAVERYDPATDEWAILAPKPVAVADVSAAVVGGRIYVPGGRLASGLPTNLLEVYDPRFDRWENRASLPIPLSAYALAAFEGRLYIFGGWDGRKYLASVYEYDPGRDRWTELTPMPTARGYAGAAVAGGIIYVIGGYDGTRAVAVNEGYTPERDGGGDSPWQSYRPLPAARFDLGVIGIADIVLVIGGEGDQQPLPPLAYSVSNDKWETWDALPLATPWSGLKLTVVETTLHALGGTISSDPTAHHLAYHIIYITVLPFIGK